MRSVYGPGPPGALETAHGSHEIGERRGLHLPHDAGAMDLDGLRAQFEFRGDHAVGLAMHDEVEDLMFPFGETLESRPGVGPGGVAVGGGGAETQGLAHGFEERLPTDGHLEVVAG